MYRSLQTVLNATRYEHSIDIESLTPSDTDFYQHLVRLAKTDRMQLAFLYGQAHHFIKSRPEEVAEDDVVSKHYQMLDQFCAQENIHMRRPIQQ